MVKIFAVVDLGPRKFFSAHVWEGGRKIEMKLCLLMSSLLKLVRQGQLLKTEGHQKIDIHVPIIAFLVVAASEC